MQKIDSENTFLYQKIWTFYLENQKKSGRIAIMRMKWVEIKLPLLRKPSACKKKTYLKYAEN